MRRGPVRILVELAALSVALTWLWLAWGQAAYEGLFARHVGLVAVEWLSHTRHRPTLDSFSMVLPAALFADAFPFVLWALFAGGALKDLFSRARVEGD